MKLLKHYRRPRQHLEGGNWHVDCDCGWSGSTRCDVAGRVKTGAEASADLEAVFVKHLPATDRRSYLLIDQRQVEVPNEDEVLMLPRGNFLMPIGEPCTLLKWREEAGVRLGMWLIETTGETGELPVGEIRTADNRVFKLDD